LLDGLSAKARTAFLMSRLEGLAYKEIAARLGVSVASVEKYMAAAVRHCYLAQL
jgi:DNA-directed RNA polymerase specialized sigma24 family protein